MAPDRRPPLVSEPSAKAADLNTDALVVGRLCALLAACFRAVSSRVKTRHEGAGDLRAIVDRGHAGRLQLADGDGRVAGDGGEEPSRAALPSVGLLIDVRSNHVWWDLGPSQPTAGTPPTPLLYATTR